MHERAEQLGPGASEPPTDPLGELCAGRINRVTLTLAGELVASEAAVPAAVLPGSFDPLHEGHRRLAGVAADLLGRPVSFELSVRNVDKPALFPVDLRHRIAQFAGLAPLELTDAPSFLAKARLLPGAAFVIGVDTAHRLLDPRYHVDDAAVMIRNLCEIRRHGVRFLVAGRRLPGGRFRTLSDLTVPAELTDCFQAIPEDRFRLDLSSTQLRAHREG